MFRPSRTRPTFAPLDRSPSFHFTLAVATLTVALLVGGLLAGGCSQTPTDPLLAGDADGTYGGRDVLPFGIESNGSGEEHDYFPFTPGRASQFDVLLAGVDEPERAMVVVVGRPEEFFGRTAVPWVYQAIPGELPDSTFLDLRQYWSVSPDGALWFHGAQNKGAMSFYEPPVRALPARPKGGESWRDTVVLQSFLPGIGLFDSATVVFETKLSESTLLRLPAGNLHVFRANQTVLDVIRSRQPVERGEETAKRPELEVLKGFWFARKRGIVARDYPFGPGPTNTNIRTYALRAQGTAPVPSPEPVPGL